MGPPASPNFSAIGDNVNIAARLEALCKEYDVTLIVSEDTVRNAGLDLSHFDRREAPVRGRAGPVTVYLVPEPGTIGEITDIETRQDAIASPPVV